MAKIIKKEKIPKIETKSDNIDILANDVLSIINKTFKDFPNAVGFLSNANMVTDWVSTGCDILDLAISNRPNGGIALGAITEISGLPGSSKSLIAAHILSNAQKQGGLAVLFDTEKAVGMLDFYRSIGLNPEKTVYSDSIRTLEEIYAAIDSIILKTIESKSDKPVVIIVDSVMGASTKAELEADYDVQGYATKKAIINSGAMRKFPGQIAGRKIAIVLINQLRANMNAGFGGDPYITSGGNAIPFAASTRLRTKVISKSSKNMDGETVEVSIVKNRFGPPRKKVTFDIYYDSGIDNYGSWLKALKDLGVLKSAGSLGFAYDYIDEETGELITKKFKDHDFEKLLNDNPNIKEMIYNQICEAYIMKYDTGEEEEIGIDDVTLDTGSEIED